MFKLVLISNVPEVAHLAEESGIDRIMIDLEKIGKAARQGHLNTLMSDHSLEDIKDVKSSLSKSELIVRVNPINSNSEREIDSAIENGADYIMLPMFDTAEEVANFYQILNGRCKSILLVETIRSALRLPEILALKGHDEVYFGLNDLRISTGLDFLFEAVSGRLIEHLGSIANEAEVPWGFGGMARIGYGELPAELVLAEHYRLGSSSVILSRAFHKSSITIDDFRSNIDLNKEVSKIREAEKALAKRSEAEKSHDLRKLQETVYKIASDIRYRNQQ